jgi:hypothetical protein
MIYKTLHRKLKIEQYKPIKTELSDVQIQAFPNDDQTTLRSTLSKVIATKKGKIDSQEQAMEMELNSI